MKRIVTVFVSILLLFSIGQLFIGFHNLVCYSSPAYEDFTTYDESDSNNRYSRATNVLTISDLNRQDDNHYVADSKGSGHFGDFDHKVDIHITDTTDTSSRVYIGTIWGLANSENDFSQFANREEAFFLMVVARITNGKYELDIISCYNPWTGDGSIELDEDTTYYLRIKRSSSTMTVGIYSSDSDRESETSPVDTLTMTGISTATLEYVYASCSVDASYSRVVSGTVSNLDLQEVVEYDVTFYHTSGGILRVNNATVSNGTENTYANGTVLELVAIVEGNLTYGFANFTWDSSSSISNPYNLTIVAAYTVWCYFQLVYPEPIAPVARFNSTAIIIYVNQTVTLNGSMSKDPNDGSLTNYSWNFGDGNTTSGNYPTITHKWLSVGIYVINLTVTDDESITDWFVEEVNVTTAPVSQPTFSAPWLMYGVTVGFIFSILLIPIYVRWGKKA